MITISVCMIVKNEEEVLARCLTCAKQISDEIILVDTGSEDQTKQIAQKYTDKIYDFEWCDDFSKARNYAFSKATCEYCMWLDGDDVILDEDMQKIIKLKQSLQKNIDIVMMKYNTAFDAQGNPTFSYYRERLIKNNAGHTWQGVIHEVIPLVGQLQYEDIAITHQKIRASDPDRNINIFEKQIMQGVKLDPRGQFYYARELYYHARYQEAYDTFQSFLTEGKGWSENNIDACQMMGYCSYYLKNEKQALQNFFMSFAFALPRAEICCDIGKHFFDRNQFQQAIYWYQEALMKERNDTTGAFIKVDCYGYIPCLQLSVCYWKLNDLTKAKEYNEKAGVFKPTSKEVQKNRAFFRSL